MFVYGISILFFCANTEKSNISKGNIFPNVERNPFLLGGSKIPKRILISWIEAEYHNDNVQIPYIDLKRYNGAAD